jgi:hypothetical protein
MGAITSYEMGKMWQVSMQRVSVTFVFHQCIFISEKECRRVSFGIPPADVLCCQEKIGWTLTCSENGSATLFRVVKPPPEKIFLNVLLLYLEYNKRLKYYIILYYCASMNSSDLYSPRTKLHDFEYFWALSNIIILKFSKICFSQNGVFIIMFPCQDSYNLDIRIQISVVHDTWTTPK